MWFIIAKNEFCRRGQNNLPSLVSKSLNYLTPIRRVELRIVGR
jgi:hypothetical protein